MTLDHKLARLDQALEAAHAQLDTLYEAGAGDHDKEQAFDRLLHIERERNLWRSLYTAELDRGGMPESRGRSVTIRADAADFAKALETIRRSVQRLARDFHEFARKHLGHLRRANEEARNPSPRELYAPRRSGEVKRGQLTRAQYRQARPAGVSTYERTSTWRM